MRQGRRKTDTVSIPANNYSVPMVQEIAAFAPIMDTATEYIATDMVLTTDQVGHYLIIFAATITGVDNTISHVLEIDGVIVSSTETASSFGIKTLPETKKPLYISYAIALPMGAIVRVLQKTDRGTLYLFDRRLTII